MYMSLVLSRLSKVPVSDFLKISLYIHPLVEGIYGTNDQCTVCCKFGKWLDK